MYKYILYFSILVLLNRDVQAAEREFELQCELSYVRSSSAFGAREREFQLERELELVRYLRDGDEHSVEIINLSKSKGIINPKPKRPAPAVQDLHESQVNQGELNNGGWCTIL